MPTSGLRGQETKHPESSTRYKSFYAKRTTSKSEYRNSLPESKTTHGGSKSIGVVASPIRDAAMLHLSTGIKPEPTETTSVQ